MPKILVDTNELKSVINSVSSILKSGVENVGDHRQQQHSVNYELNEKEKLILNYIEKNEGTTQEGLIKNLGKYTRVPISKNIHTLAKEGLILIRNDEHNSQTHRLFINKENALVTLIQDLDFFKQAYFKLIDKTKGKYIELNHSAGVVIKQGKDATDLFNRVCDLHESMLLPYSFIIMKYNFSDLFSMPEHLSLIHI